jgi:TetR/AcrR family transcriptional regulator, transcriptional repressor for nem operon
MTDSDVQDRSGKRARLVAGASDLLHRQGVQQTTLAEIAEVSGVPPGNVYYYFKTKDELVQAVIDSWADRLRALLESFEGRRSPRARLKALAHSWVDMGELITRYGCPLGTLCSELEKRDDDLAREAAKLFALPVDWAEEQFRQIGRRDARELAITLLAGVQGAALLANTLRDAEIMTRQERRLERWIDSLS